MYGSKSRATLKQGPESRPLDIHELAPRGRKALSTLDCFHSSILQEQFRDQVTWRYLTFEIVQIAA